jgi:hypothetical protein
MFNKLKAKFSAWLKRAGEMSALGQTMGADLFERLFPSEPKEIHPKGKSAIKRERHNKPARGKRRGVGITRKDKSPSKKKRLMAKQSKRRNRK